MHLHDLLGLASGLTEADRPIRLRLTAEQGVLDDVLLVKSVSGQEAFFDGLTYRVLCVSTRAGLELMQFVGVPAELQFVTDRGGLRSVCGIVAEVAEGQSDGGLATYQLVIRDALAFMEHKTNTRVFRNKNEVEITEQILSEWRLGNPVCARAFDVEPALIRTYPKREFTMQRNESDAAFLRRLWKRRGIAWFIRPGRASETGSDETPAHTLVLTDATWNLPQNAAGTIRYHRDAAAEQRDSVFGWTKVRRLRPGLVSRHSWNYKDARPTTAETAMAVDQGPLGRELAASMTDYLADPPHVGENREDYDSLTRLRMQRHEYEVKCYHGESGVRDLCPGEWNLLTDHPEIDGRPREECEFMITELTVFAENNLPKPLNDQVGRLFAASDWKMENGLSDDGTDEQGSRYRNRFTCVRRGIPVVPSFDPRTDLPTAHPTTAIVVGPAGEQVHCDALGRVKVRFTECRPDDHAHAQGAGASGSDRDSAWVRVGTGWAGERFGVSMVPRAQMEALIIFLDGDVDKPVIVQLLPNGKNPTPTFSAVSRLPDERYLSGIKSREVHGTRHNQLRMDDTPGQISAQLASEHGYSQVNAGYLTHPRHEGKGTPRGEGIETRTDGHLAQRGGSGVYITADPQPRAGGDMLDRGALVGLAEVLQSVQQQLSELSGTHHAETTEGAKLAQIVRQLKDWDRGTNVDPQGAGGGAPMVAVSAPAGIGIASQDNLLLGAQTHIDAVSAGNTQLSAGRKLLMRAAESISVFAHKLGMKLIAASGKMELQTHKDNIELTSAKEIVLTAADRIVLQAPRVCFIAQGAQVDIGSGAITQQSSGAHTIMSSSFAHSGPGGGSPAGVKLPASGTKYNQHVRLTDLVTGEPLVNQRYRVELEDGQVIEGTTDAQGLTQVLKSSIAFGRYTIQALTD